MIDLQVNGLKTNNISCNFWQSPKPEEILALSKYQKKQGVKNYLATIITDSQERIEKNLTCIKDYLSQYDDEQLFGVHLEGGLISKAGVHPQQYLEAIHYKEAQELIKKFPGLIKLWTLCPKLDKNADLTKLLQDSGIKVSYGHSDADFETAMNAFEKTKVNLVTHWGNALYVYDGFKQRNCQEEDLTGLDDHSAENAGIGLAAYRNPNVILMAIAGSKANYDLHLDEILLKKIAQHKGKDKFILVSDSVFYDQATSPENLVGGLSSLKTQSQNALAAGLSKEEVKAATHDLAARLFDLD